MLNKDNIGLCGLATYYGFITTWIKIKNRKLWKQNQSSWKHSLSCEGDVSMWIIPRQSFTRRVINTFGVAYMRAINDFTCIEIMWPTVALSEALCFEGVSSSAPQKLHREHQTPLPPAVPVLPLDALSHSFLRGYPFETLCVCKH